MAVLPLYAVFGNPIAHSQSPQIHRQFALQEAVEIEYRRILVAPDAFPATIARFFASGGQGANITLPFKINAYTWVEACSERAEAAGAVNTVVPLENGGFYGDNTDGIGLIHDITQVQDITVQNKHILILGAGGAVRGAIPLLQQALPASITLANRTMAKAQALARQFGIDLLDLNNLHARKFDIVINGTSGGLSGTAPAIAPAVFKECELAYDMAYGAAAQAFLNHARRAGTQHTADGLGMLVAQAAYAYRLWRGFMPDIKPVIRYMRQAV